MSAAACDAPGFSEAHMWRGPAWLNTSFFAHKGLKDCGHGKLAGEMRTTLLGWVANDMSSVRKYYNRERAKVWRRKAPAGQWPSPLPSSSTGKINLTACFPKL